MLLPVWDNMWEDYHTAINLGRNVPMVAKQIAVHLSLRGQPDTFDLFDSSGKRASISFRYGDPWHNAQRFIFIRQDLLERYLAETETELLLAVWGERKYHSVDTEELRKVGQTHRIYRPFQAVLRYAELVRGKRTDGTE